MTYRDRRAARADRLRSWADKRITTASAALDAMDKLPYAHDIAFLTQPGKIPARTRMNAATDAAFRSLAKASDLSARAASIDSAAAIAIYSDDVDAVDRLTSKIAKLSADRDRITAYNKSCRIAAKTGGRGDLSILTDADKVNLSSIAKHTPYNVGPGGAFPGYATANLSGNISRLKKRLAGL